MTVYELHSCIASPRVKQAYFTPELFTFLRQLKRHNNREWFQANKNRYETSVRDPFLKFIEDFRPRLHNISPHFIAEPKASGGSLLRIYKDLRFRPDAALSNDGCRALSSSGLEAGAHAWFLSASRTAPFVSW